MSPLTDAVPPEHVYVPTGPQFAGDTEVHLVLRQLDDELVLLTYSSVEELVAGCGPHQPWASLRSDLVGDLLPQMGATAVLLDVPLPEEDRVGPP